MTDDGTYDRTWDIADDTKNNSTRDIKDYGTYDRIDNNTRD